MLKIGDKVRFLNDVGGGTVTGFQGKDLVLVADADGFEIPTLITEVVAVETDDYNIAKVVAAQKKQKAAKGEKTPTSIKNALKVDDEAEDEEEEETDVADKELTYRPLAQERRGANELNYFLAFVPHNVKQIADTSFDVYFVNDCNYYVHYSLFTYEGRACHLRHEGEVAPNTKVHLETLAHNRLEEWERLTVQTLSFKRNKIFLPKPTFSINVRVDGTKFFKAHAFHETDFFHQPALVYHLVKDDHAARSMFVDADELQEAMQTPEEQMHPNVVRISAAERRAAQKQSANDLLEVDLHAEALLDLMVGLDAKDILQYQLKVFRDTMNEHLKQRGKRIVFIHGKGEGVLRNAIIKELRTRYAQCRYQDASFREYGYGATMVTI